jgi:hypothetical protein
MFDELPAGRVLGQPAWKATLVTSLAIMAVSVIAILIDLTIVVVNCVRMLFGTGHLETALPPGPGVVSGLLSLPSALLYFCAGFNLLVWRKPIVIVAAALLGMVPFLSFDWMTGVPLGIWVLYLLRHPSVRQLFAHASRETTAS